MTDSNMNKQHTSSVSEPVCLGLTFRLASNGCMFATVKWYFGANKTLSSAW